MATAWELRFAEYVQRLASLRESTVLDILPDLMPVMPVLDPASPDVQRYRQEKLVSRGFDATAAAAQFETHYFGALAGSNVILTLRRFWVSSVVAQEVSFLPGAFTPVGPASFLSDDRRETSGTIQSQGFSVSEVANFGSSRKVLVPANTTLVLDYPLVLPPGTFVAVQAGTAASRLIVVAFGFERTVQQSEFR